MIRSPLERLRDARHFGCEAAAIALGMDHDIFEMVHYYHYGLRYCLLAMGEALRFVPVEVQARDQEIAWRSIIALRHRLAHDYWLTDSRMVLEIANRHLDDLLPRLDRLIAELEGEAGP